MNVEIIYGLSMLCSVLLGISASVIPKYIYRGSTKTCLPVLNCEETFHPQISQGLTCGRGKLRRKLKLDHSVKACTVSGRMETCEPCRNGTVQPNLISSLDSELDRECFRPRSMYDCPDADTVHSRTRYTSNWCNLPCKCNTNKCFWGSPCVCNHKDPPCREGEELNVDTGECTPCRDGMHKEFVGCGPCRYKTINTSVVVRDDESHPDSMDEIGSTLCETSVYIIGGVTAAILLVAVSVVVIIIVAINRKTERQETNLRHTNVHLIKQPNKEHDDQ